MQVDALTTNKIINGKKNYFIQEIERLYSNKINFEKEFLEPR